MPSTAKQAIVSSHQTAGLRQINQAISEMDEVTQQNAGLVEQAAAATAALQHQAGNLASVVSVFKIDVARASVANPLRAARQPVLAILANIG